MVIGLGAWNPAAMTVLQRIFDAAKPFQTLLLGTEITVSLERQPSEGWPEPPPARLKPDGPWPDALVIRAEWSGGAALLRAKVVCTSDKRYERLLVLRVQAKGGQPLIWLNMSSALAYSEDGTAHLRVFTAIVKRGDNTAQSEALLRLTTNAGLPFASAKSVSLGKVQVSSGELISDPQELWETLIRFCLLKIPFLSSDPRDIEGRHFVTTSASETSGIPGLDTLETVTATTHNGLMLPVLNALSLGAADPAAIENRVLELHGAQLTPGDQRRKANGTVLWRYNIRWALTYLKQRGEAENPVRSRWSITQAGRRRLEQELETFDIRPFQTLQAKVIAEGADVPANAPVIPIAKSVPPKRIALWHERLAAILDRATLDRLASRIRPDLGASPAEAFARNVIFVGPPGTGKTWVAEKVAHALTDEAPSATGHVRLVQFHPSYGYEDFVWSIRPVLSGESAGFREAPGPFLSICKDALEDPDDLYVLIIDEINRGDPARIFGELLYALEYRGKEILLANGGALTVPTNLVLLGTMNSVDRSVAMVDYALRRRFAFVRVDPNPALIASVHGTKASLVASEALSELNRAIRELGDPELQLGHSYFLTAGRTLASEADLATVWALDLAPQLAELFHGRSSVLSDLTRTWNDAVRRCQSAPEPEAAEDEEEQEEEPEASDAESNGVRPEPVRA